MALKHIVFPKNCPAAGGSAPRPPSVIILSYTSLLNTSPILHIYTFFGGLSSFPLPKSWLCAKHRPRLLIFQSTISSSYKKFFFRDFTMTSLHVVCLPPNQKSWLRLWPSMLVFVEKSSNFLAHPKRNFAPSPLEQRSSCGFAFTMFSL